MSTKVSFRIISISPFKSSPSEELFPLYQWGNRLRKVKYLGHLVQIQLCDFRACDRPTVSPPQDAASSTVDRQRGREKAERRGSRVEPQMPTLGSAGPTGVT